MMKTSKERQDARPLRILLQDIEPSQDPALAAEDQSYLIVKMLFDGLCRLDPDGKPSLALAESYEANENATQFTFRLRDSRWSNGAPITAYDFEYSWKKALQQPHSAFPFLFPLFLLKNGKLANEKKISIDRVGVKAVSDRTLSIELEYPAPNFLEIAAHWSFSLINNAAEQSYPAWASSHGEEYVCNGPFKLAARVPHLLLEKNPEYWDAKNVKLEKIAIHKLEPNQDPIQTALSTSSDVIGRPLISFPLDALKTEPPAGYELCSFPLQGVLTLCFNTDKAPFGNKKMRRAFSYSIDRTVFPSLSPQEFDQPSSTILPPLLSLHDKPLFPEQDLPKARQLFREALEESGAELPALKLCFCDSMNRSALFHHLKESWEEIFGLRIELVPSPWGAHFRRMSQGEFHIGAIELNALWSDPLHFLEFFGEKNNSLNLSRWENRPYQNLLQKARTSPHLRKELLKEAEALIAEESPAIPLYSIRGMHLKKKNVSSLNASPYFLIDCKWANKE
jgi:oligopeptide transport system substrate-binding protein